MNIVYLVVLLVYEVETEELLCHGLVVLILVSTTVMVFL